MPARHWVRSPLALQDVRDTTAGIFLFEFSVLSSAGYQLDSTSSLESYNRERISERFLDHSCFYQRCDASCPPCRALHPPVTYNAGGADWATSAFQGGEIRGATVNNSLCSAGKTQSPVNIVYNFTRYDSKLKPVNASYEQPRSFNLTLSGAILSVLCVCFGLMERDVSLSTTGVVELSLDFQLPCALVPACRPLSRLRHQHHLGRRAEDGRDHAGRHLLPASQRAFPDFT